jgi:signal transduction histidine kinase
VDVQRTRSDATALGQILLNLLINACHALPPERAAGNAIELGASVVEGKLVLRVSDNGHGIPEDRLAHIFEPRFTTKGGGGSGLGLAISQDLAGQLGGSLICRSVPGQGTTFELVVPYSPVP